MPDFRFDQEIPLFLATCRTASLATVDSAGQPHAANVQYAHDDAWRLFWVSSPDALHSRHIVRDGRCAMTIYAADDRAEHIHGLQLHGLSQVIEDEAEKNRVWELYIAKYTFVAAMPHLRQAMEAQRFYSFQPTWLRWIDNRRGFGWKIEKRLDV